MTTKPGTGNRNGTELLADLFSSHVRAAVLSHLAPREGAAYSLTELARTLDLAVSSVQHECYKLERLRLLIGQREGSSRRYRLSPEHPLTDSLRRVVLAALGTEAAFHAAVSELPGLTGAALCSPDGTVAGPVTGADLVLIGDLDLAALAMVQHRIATILAIDDDKVTVAYFSPARWQQHRADGHPLVFRLETLARLATWGEIA